MEVFKKDLNPYKDLALCVFMSAALRLQILFHLPCKSFRDAYSVFLTQNHLNFHAAPRAVWINTQNRHSCESADAIRLLTKKQGVNGIQSDSVIT